MIASRAPSRLCVARNTSMLRGIARLHRVARNTSMLQPSMRRLQDTRARHISTTTTPEEEDIDVDAVETLGGGFEAGFGEGFEEESPQPPRPNIRGARLKMKSDRKRCMNDPGSQMTVRAPR